MKRALGAVVFLAACASADRPPPRPPPSPEPPPPAPVVASAEPTPPPPRFDPPIAPETQPFAMAPPAPPALVFEYVNLASNQERFTVDAGGRAYFTSVRNTMSDQPTRSTDEGPTVDADLKALSDTLSRLNVCTTKPPANQLSSWAEMRVDLHGVKCTVRLDADVWRQRFPQVLTALDKIGKPVCGDCGGLFKPKGR